LTARLKNYILLSGYTDEVSRQLSITFTVLSDATRVRMLAVLEGRELTVSEFVHVVRCPQSTVSRI